MNTKAPLLQSKTSNSTPDRSKAPEAFVNTSSNITSTLLRKAKTNPKILTPGDIISLQRTLGNQAVQRLLTKPQSLKTDLSHKINPISPVIVQRNVGFEIEIGGGEGWRVWEAGKDMSKDEGEQERSKKDEIDTLINIKEAKEYEQFSKDNPTYQQDYQQNQQTRNKAIAHNQKREEKLIGQIPKGWFMKKRKTVPPSMQQVLPVFLNKLPKGIKGDPVIDGHGFQMQVEDNGSESTVEFVTNAPGIQGRDQFDSTMKDMQKVGENLAEFNGGAPFLVTRGKKEFIVKPGISMSGSMQSTVGVPLASVPQLYKKVSGLVGDDVYSKATTKGKNAGQELVTQGILPEDHKVSPELEGFLTIIKFYLNRGMGTELRSFPKAIFEALNRTDFHKMFTMLDPTEANAIKEHLAEWVTIMVETVDKKKPLMNQSFNYDEQKVKPPMRINTTREEWLTSMPEKDLLTFKEAKKDKNVSVYMKGKDTSATTEDVKQKNPANYDLVTSEEAENNHNIQATNPALLNSLVTELEDFYQGLGGYGNKTDRIKYQDSKEETESVIIELRNANRVSTPNTWYKGSKEIYDLVEEVIKYPNGKQGEDDPGREFEHVETPKQKEIREGYGKQKKAQLDKVIQALIVDSRKRTVETEQI